MKKTIIHNVATIAVLVGILASSAIPLSARAQTVESLTAQINSLLATITSLQAQLAALQSGGGDTTQQCYTFSQNLTLGSTGAEVTNLQKFLNLDPATRIATTGAGSPGNESAYFGQRTKSAVIAFQTKYATDVLAPAGLSSGTGFWGSLSRAKANALETTRCSTSTPTPPVTETPSATVTVAAVTQPANSLAPSNASRVAFTNFSLKNNGNTPVTVHNVTVQIGGLADKSAFSGVVLLDEQGAQLGVSKVLNSNNQAVIGESLVLQPGQTKTFTVAANMGTIGSTYAGQIASFSVIGVNTSSTITGSLPIVGASHTLNGTLNIGTLTAARGSLDPAAARSKEVGATNYTFSSIRLTAGSNENVRIRSMRWNQSGSASSNDLANVAVYVDDVAYTPTVSSDGKYYRVSFGSGIVLQKGSSKDFSIKGDLVGGAGRTVSFDIYRATDIYATGETYGYGLTANDGNSTTENTVGTFDDESTPAYNAFDVTITAGTVNALSKSNKVAAGTVAKQVPNEILGAFELQLAGEGITVSTVKFAIDTTENSGSAVDANDITMITLVDQNGTVLAGPVDGNATDYTPTGGSLAEGSVSFSSVDFPRGLTTVYVKGRLGSDFDTNDTITIRTNAVDWVGARGEVTGNTITLPNALVSANVRTVRAGAITVTTLQTPVAQGVAKGATGFVWLKGNLDASNSGEDIRVTALGVTNTPSAGAAATDIDNLQIWANLNGIDTDGPRGDGYETLVATGDNFSSASAGVAETITVVLDTPIVVERNKAIGVQAVADLSGSASGTTGVDSHTVKIASVTAVGAQTGSLISVAPVGNGQAMTIQASGTMTVTVDSSSPSAKLLIDDEVNVQNVAVFRLAGNNIENLRVDSIRITDDGDATQGADDVVARYVLFHGTTKLGEVTNVNGTARIFLAHNALIIPKNEHVLVTVGVIVNNIDNTAVQNGDAVRVTIASAGDIEATGLSSGTKVLSTQSSVDAAIHRVYEAYPHIAFDTTGMSSVLIPQANYQVAKITITNKGTKDITFDSDDQIKVNFEISGALTSATNAVTAKADGETLATVNLGATTGSTSATIDFSSKTLTIPVGQTKTMLITVNTSGLTTSGNTIQAWLSDDADNNLIYSIDAGVDDYAVGTNVFKGDLFGLAHVRP